MSDAGGETPPVLVARVGVLGPVAVQLDGEWVEPSGRRGKAILAALALAAPRALSPELLADDVWGDEPPRAARGALQALVSRLRGTFGDGLIESTASGYRLGHEPTSTDLGAAAALAARAAGELEAGAADDASRSAAEGLALWRGDVGADLEPGALADALAARADGVAQSLELTAATAALARGAAGEAEDFARRLSARAPFDDNAHLVLMRALDAQGRSTEAVALFATFRARVQDAFGTSPPAALQAVHLDLLDRALEPTLAHPAPYPAPADPPAGGVARGIRAAPNALIGRESAVQDVLTLLAQSRVTTILGAGGLGKTRLAHEVAARALSTFPAVVVVELASVRAAGDVVFALASGLGIREIGTSRRVGDQLVRADLRTRILNRLGERRTLLVIDNCEHLIDAAADWVAALASEVPGLTVLTTSRTALAISSERVYALERLGGARQSADTLLDDPAVRLFVDRATAARPGATLPRDVVARLCDRLDGLPLAIELAAARTRSMSLDEIERRLGNRFALLTSGDRSAPERHRTLLAVIEWSWNLLGAHEQQALARLSEFADGFSLEAARAVVGPDVDDALDGLVAQSLVAVGETGETGEGLRFRMLETVREFGRLELDRSGQRDAVQRALFDWADRLGSEALARMSGPEQVPTFAAVAVEEGNLIDVLRRAIAAERPDIVVSVFALLAWYWSLRSAHSEVIAFGRTVFRSVRRYEPSAERAAATQATLVIIGVTMLIVEPRFAVLPLSRLRKVLAVHPATDPRLAAMCEIALSAGSLVRIDAGVERARRSSDRPTALLGNIVASIAAENGGRRTEAVAFAKRAVSLADSVGDTWGAAMAAQMLGQLYSQSAEPEEALRWAYRAREGMTRIGATEDLRQLEWVIAANALSSGRIDEAEEIFERLIVSAGDTDGVDIRSIGLAGRAEVLRARGLVVEAAEANRVALATFDVPRTRSSPWFRMIVSSVLASLVIDGTALPGEARRWARRLRSRALASLRPQGAYVDQPVLGASLVGLAAWVDAPATGLALAALAESMGSRQDNPGLHLAPLFARFAAELGDDAVAAARASAAQLPDDERPGRAAALLRTPGPWSWAWNPPPA